LAKYLENLKKFLDKGTNVLSEPGKIQVQMVEGEAVFNEAIDCLNGITHLKPLQWDDNLALSAMEHVQDIGPKGLLSYQSSDGTEPEERISRYGNYVESLGENIDFGPNDAMGVLISLTLDDGEPDRPHRENLFKSDYLKVGMACGPHKTEYQMCVMDFAYDFTGFNDDVEGDGEISQVSNDTLAKGNLTPIYSNQTHQSTLLSQSNKNQLPNGNKSDVSKLGPNAPVPSSNTHVPAKMNYNNNNDFDMFVDPSSTANFSNNPKNPNNKSVKTNKYEETFGYPSNPITVPSNSNTQIYPNIPNPQPSVPSNLSPLVRLSLDNDESKNRRTNENLTQVNNLANVQVDMDEEEALAKRVKQINIQKRVLTKNVEVTTRIVYTYEDGSTKEVIEKQNHVFDLSQEN
jgi:hypothetical protein